MRKGIARTVLVALACLAPMGSSEILADEGRIPIHSLPGPTFVIVAPGHYLLTENVTFAGTIIVIRSNDVTVDLNEFTLTGVPGSPVIVIDSGSALFNITIRNGSLNGGSAGIQHIGLSRIRVRIQNVSVNATDLRGISIDRAAHVEIEGCHVRNATGDDGIFVSGFSALFNGRFVDNEVVATGGYGIRLEGLQGGEVLRNITTLYGNNAGLQAGIRLTDLGVAPGLGAGSNIIEGNSAVRPLGATEDGIILNSSDGNLIERNTVKGNTASGIRLEDSARNKLHENVAQGNTLSGLDSIGAASVGNFFLDNEGGDNGGLGIDCGAAGNHLRGNVFFGDGFGAGCVLVAFNVP